MKSIKVIKRNREDQPKDPKPSESEKSVKRGTREMVSTVKSWIDELQQRKRVQSPSFPQLPVIATEPATQNT